MVDIIIQPAADDDDDLTNAIVLNDVTLPLQNQSMAALGLSLGVSYKARVLGTAATFMVSLATWEAPTVNGTGDGAVTLAAGANAASAPSAPTIDSTGDGSVTLNAA